jgi:hypothetical protein
MRHNERFQVSNSYFKSKNGEGGQGSLQGNLFELSFLLFDTIPVVSVLLENGNNGICP